MSTISAGEAIVRVLEAEGARCVFGLPGGHVIGIYDALYRNQQIRHILVRHEQHAASMAAGYAQLTGEPGICLVTAGPGATNLVSGIAEANMGALPIVILAGRGMTGTSYRGASQEIATERLFAPITKWSTRVDRADRIVEVLRRAFTIARSGKPGAVYVDLPRDIVDQRVEFDGYSPVGRPPPPQGNPEAIALAAAALTRAERPIIIAGGGTVASGAFSELAELAEMTASPVLTSLSGRGSIRDDHPLSAGGLGAHRNAASRRLFMEADFVLALGFRFEEMETNWRPGFLPRADACIVQVDIDAEEIGRSVAATIPVVGDVRLVLQGLIGEVRAGGRGLAPGAFRTHPRTRALAEEIAAVEAEIGAMAAGGEKPIHPVAVFRAAQKVFPRETTLCVDVGAITQQIAGAFPFTRVHEPRSCLVPSSFYGMGFASAALPVARLVYPDRPAIAFSGDGSFQMVMNVLPCAAENGLAVTWCVLDDRALGSIRDIQENRLEGRFLATDFAVQPDFARIAEACGCYGEKVEEPAEVAPALARALEENRRGRPAVLDFMVARARLPQTLEFMTGTFKGR